MKRSAEPVSNLSLLHAIRGVAALYVVVYHAKFILWVGGKEYMAKFPRSGWNIFEYVQFGFDMLFSAGSQMVIIFFVLSGYFIAMSLEKLKGSSINKLLSFYCVRLIRIYIPFIASVVLSVLILLLIAKLSPDLYQLSASREFNNRLIAAYHDLTLSNFFKGLIFSKNNEYIGFNYAYWSLLYEGIFYLIVPFVYTFKKQYLIVSAVFYFIGIIAMNNYHSANVFVQFLFQYNFYFAVGQAMWQHRKKLEEIFSTGNYKAAIILLSVCLFIAYNFLAILNQFFFANLLSAIFACLLMQLFINYDIKNNLIIRAIKKLGEISYSLYLVHIPTLIFLYVIFHKYTSAIFFYQRIYLLGVVMSIITGYLFFNLAEAPSLRLIKKIKVLLNGYKFKPGKTKFIQVAN